MRDLPHHAGILKAQKLRLPRSKVFSSSSGPLLQTIHTPNKNQQSPKSAINLLEANPACTTPGGVSGMGKAVPVLPPSLELSKADR